MPVVKARTGATKAVRLAAVAAERTRNMATAQGCVQVQMESQEQLKLVVSTLIEVGNVGRVRGGSIGVSGG